MTHHSLSSKLSSLEHIHPTNLLFLTETLRVLKQGELQKLMSVVV